METLKFSKSVTDLVKQRSSWRSYSSRRLEAGLADSVRKFLNEQTAGPFGHKMRFILVEKDHSFRFDNASLGTYGFIKNARSFIVGALRPGKYHWEDYGFIFEKIILKMTDLGLGTCWMGGTFNRTEFGRAINVKDVEIIPAVTPVGYRTDGRSLRDSLIRRGARSHSRKHWEKLFFDEKFGEGLSPEKIGKYALALEMVRLAPSSSNKQPWRVVHRNRNFHFFLKRNSNSLAFHRSSDLQRIDMGIAMCHFELTAKEYELKGSWSSEPVTIELPRHCEHIFTWRDRSFV